MLMALCFHSVLWRGCHSSFFTTTSHILLASIILPFCRRPTLWQYAGLKGKGVDPFRNKLTAAHWSNLFSLLNAELPVNLAILLCYSLGHSLWDPISLKVSRACFIYFYMRVCVCMTSCLVGWSFFLNFLSSCPLNLFLYIK